MNLKNGRNIFSNALFLIREFISKLIEHRAFSHASILSYITIISFVPFVSFVLFLLLKAIDNQTISSLITNFLFEYFMPETGDKVKDYILNLIDSGSYLITAFGVVMVLLASASLIRGIQAAFDSVWGQDRKSIFIRRYFIFWIIIIVAIPTAASIITITLALKNQFILAPQIANPRVWEVALKVFAFIVTYGVFFTMYYLATTGFVPGKSAAIGAAFATTLWYIFKWGFQWYIHSFARYDELYGSLGIIPVFFLWIFLAWLDVIIGCEFSYFATYYKNILQTKNRRTNRLYDNYYALRILDIIASRYRKNLGATSHQRLINAIDIPYTEAKALINKLIRAHLIVKSDSEDFLFPRMDFSTVSIYEIIKHLSNGHYEVPPHKTDTFSLCVKEHFHKLKAQKQKNLSRIQLKDLHKLPAKIKKPEDNSLENKDGEIKK